MLRKAIALMSIAGSLGLASAPASAQGSPTGVWIDHTGRGAVEISDCNGALCGHIVWVKDSKHLNTCRNQVLGNVKPVGGNTWDRGWILDPDDDKRYSVELKPIGNDRLRVVGYMGSKLFSETMTWKRAPETLERCDGKATPGLTPAAVPAPAQPNAPPTREAAITPPPAIDPSPAPITVSPLPQPAAAPAVVGPDATTRPATVLPPPARQPNSQTTAEPPAPPPAAGPARTAEVEVIPPPNDPPETAPRGKRKSAKRDCKVELPYITLTYPCDAF